MKKFTLLLIVLVFVSFSCKKDNSDDNNNTSAKTIEDLVVKNNEITGWNFSGTGWTANNITELTNYINGGAEIYQLHGFVEAIQQAYEGTVNQNQTQLTLYIYDQGTVSNADELFNDPNLGFSGAINWSDGAGTKAHYVRYGLSQQLAFYRDKYYVLLELNADTDESLSIMKQFALNVDGKIK